MTRIMIVDDERPVAESISLIVKRDLGTEFTVCATASSGREAIEKAAPSAAEIILMDVRMPGISGLDVIREIRRAGTSAAFILITAYERFDIAKEAVAMGIVDYLLKPVSKDKLASALHSARDYIRKSREFESKEIAYREREEWMLAFMESAFFHGMMLGERLTPENDAKYREIFGFGSGPMLTGALCYRALPGLADAASYSERLHESVRASFRYKTKAVAGPLVGNVAAFAVPLDAEKDAAETGRQLRAMLADSHREECSRGGIRLGLSEPGQLADAWRAWPKALAEAAGESEAAEQTTENFRDDGNFHSALMAGDAGSARVSLESILGAPDGPGRPESALRYRIIALFGSAYAAACGREMISPSAAASFLRFEDIEASSSLETLRANARLRFAVLSAITDGARLRSPLALKAVNYLERNFGKQISLETSADELGVSPSRLSKVFIEETGRGFSDYLIQLRIDHAKLLLSSKDASIKEVSSECGYGDPNYFSRLFKKITGVTPTNFMSGAAEGNDNV